MSVRLKNANRMSKLSSSQAVGPDLGHQPLELAVPAGGDLVDDPRAAASPGSSVAACLLDRARPRSIFFSAG